MTEKINLIKILVQDQLTEIADPLVRFALEKILIEPVLHFREWDYSSSHEMLECWTIAIDWSSDTSIIYSEFGHGPKNPWGLVTTSFPNFGMDSAWYQDLKSCFLESFPAGKLPIWFIERRADLNHPEIIQENLTLDQAFEIIDIITKQNKEYFVEVRKYDFP